ncbi:response regulator transcription factor [Plantactinospora sp. S1510]|uniref:Response regulator transcription factor n=1 Tax=Plantactinospora alkalitolerans TaxID=2789879 RepID=A0ABS0GYQ2_9ACTN|nr:response regulator transcription factor [Plantactinospora alkalitolerans]MBF9131345.1 response regulator transcription factor [Plantactinospora alkalitolerans]
MIRVLLVDDQRLVRAGLRMLCESAPDMDVVGEAENGQQAIRLAEQVAPDVVLMDLRMPVVDGTAATARIRASRPAVRVVVLTTFDDDDHLFPALAAGACGFLVKDATPDELLAAVRSAAAGETPYSPAVLRRLVDQAVRARLGEATAATLPASLTARERDVLALVGAGLSNREIADRLHLGVTTVKTHVTNLLAKTGTANRIRLALLAAQSGLVTEA